MEGHGKKYNLIEPWKTLDDWQIKYIESEGNCFLLCGRQTGKTTAMSIKFGKRAVKNKNHSVLMIAFTEKQAYNLFFKTLMYIRAVYPGMIKKGREKPTKHEINLKNGSKIMCYAAGLTGEGIRTYTVNSLVIDEAAPMAREVFAATTPMISVTNGTMDISSTPRGAEGFFYECSDKCPNVKEGWNRFYISAEDCPRHSKEFLDSEKKSMTKLEYAQEYRAEFLSRILNFFPEEEIISSMCLKKGIIKGELYLGVDVARYGGDETAFVIVRVINKNNVELVYVENEEQTSTAWIINRIFELHKRYHFRKIFMDDGGLGAPIFDFLFEKFRNRIIGLNNASRSIETEKTKRLLKEDLYGNLLRLMEQGKIKMIKNSDLARSLKSIQREVNEETGKIKIWGKYSHITEAAIRAAWCVKAKGLKLYVY